MSHKDDALSVEFQLSDLNHIMSLPQGRRTIACILELCMYEQSAMAKNAAELASNVSRQEVAHSIKDMVWAGGSKKLWRRMEDEIELRTESTESKSQDTGEDTERDPLDIEN